MPGVHTFYDGSRILEPLVPILGFDCDKLNFIFCQVVSLFLAAIYFFFSSKMSRVVRLFFHLFSGVCICYFCFGGAIKHIFGLIGVSYILLFTKNSHITVFIFSLGYLFFIHWFRWYVLNEYNIDVTGPMMIMVQKTTTLSFSLHDGTTKDVEKLDKIQKAEALSKIPSALEYLSYMLHFQTLLTGPYCVYSNYMDFICETNVYSPKPLHPYSAVAKNLFFAICSAIILFVFSNNYKPEIITESENLSKDWYVWWLLFYFVILLQRVQYYYAWSLSDAICNMSGFGFNGFTDDGKERWNFLTNVDIWKVEMGLSFKETLDGWNIMTMHWLRRVAYDRVPRNYRTFSTYILSALWHGFFPGYYITFLTGALMTLAARNFRRCIRHHFQTSIYRRLLYDIITWFATKIALIYTTFPFVTMHLYPGLFIYKRLYYFYHILAFIGAVVLPMLIPQQKKK